MSKIKKLVILAVVFLLPVAAAVRLWFLDGWLSPVRIAGGSMAPTVLGAHYELRCGDCRFPCRWDADFPPTDDRIVCPNCGLVNVGLGQATLRRGERVVVDRLAYRLRRPKRWEVVAFRADDREDYLEVKRVVGLPKETISIRHGDLYVDGGLARKSWGQLQQMAILVYDSTYRPRTSERLPPRWQAESAGSGWQRCGDRFCFEPTSSDRSRELDWLTYRHWRCLPGPGTRTEPYAVLDNYGYNQELSRQLHRVADLMLACRIRLEDTTGTLALKGHDGYSWFFVELTFATKQATLRRGRQPLTRVPLPAAAYGQESAIELALCDQQVLVAIDGQLLIDWPYERDDASFQPTSRPFGVGAHGLAATIHRLQVFRDVYYLDPEAVGWNWSADAPLGNDAFFVIGDNVPISQDSRHRPVPGIPRDRLLGRVYRGR